MKPSATVKALFVDRSVVEHPITNRIRLKLKLEPTIVDDATIVYDTVRKKTQETP